MKRYRMKTTRLIFTLTTLALLLVGCNDQWDNHISTSGECRNGTVVDAIKANAELSQFYKLLEETGYDKVLQDGYEYTVLALSNDVMANTTTSDADTRLAIVRNHIIFGAYSTQELNKLAAIKMINGKNIPLSSVSISSEKHNFLCSNGILHVVNTIIEPALNIDEYLTSLGKNTYIQLDSLYAKTERIMDMDKSVEKGVNENGQIEYDTAWIVRNPLLEKVPIHNEDSMYTFVLLDNDNFKAIKTKYARYMRQASEEATDSLAIDELLRDLILYYNEETAVLSGVEVDFSNASLVTQYTASNGTVRIMNGVDIKMSDKLKPIIIEAENYLSALDATKVIPRARTWASGGTDIMVSSRTYQIGTNEAGANVTYSFTYSSTRNTNSNFYLHYEAKMYSATYDIYWLSYDDMNWADYGVVYDANIPASRLKICQKLFASIPDEPLLGRPDASNPSIVNNYLGDMIAFVAASQSGVMQEERLCQYTLNSDVDAIRMVPVSPVEIPDPYAFTVPRMGNVMFMVCNTAGFGEEYEKVSASNKSGGMMFLDYIRLVPRIAEGD